MQTKGLRKQTASIRKTLRNKCLLVLFCFVGLNTALAQQDSIQLSKWKAVQRQPGYQSLKSTVDLLNALSIKYIYDNPDSGLYFGNLALLMAQKQHYTTGQVRALNNLGKGYYVKGSYDSSLVTSDRALKLNEPLHDSLDMGIAICNIGLVYLGHEEFEKAKKEFARALAIVTAVRDSLQMAKNYFDLGICYDETRELTQAVDYLTKAIATDPSTEDHHITAMAYNRLGKTEFHGKNYTKGIEYYEKVLNYHVYSDKWETSFACQGLAEIYYALKQYDKAVSYAKKAFEGAREMNAKWDAEQALFILAKSQAAAGDFKNAYNYQVIDQVYKDSLYADAKQQVENYFKLQAKEAANKALEKENKLVHEKVRLTWLLIILISAFALTLAVAVVLLYRNYRIKMNLNDELLQKNENISHLNQMKDQLFSVVSHDLRGPMASLQQTLELVNENELTETQQKLLMESLGHQVTVSNQMLNNLLTWAAAQRKGIAADITKIDPDVILKEILDVFEVIAYKKNIGIVYSGNYAEPLLADENQFRIIVQNLLSNAIKFTPKGGSINITFTHTAGRVAIHIKDTGIGMSKEKQEKLFKDFGAAAYPVLALQRRRARVLA